MHKLISLFIILFFCFNIKGQNVDRSNYQLLWEISGKNFEEPSYLFGSMHVEDERVFEFCDSMLVYFEKCDGFAGELHFDSMMVYVMQNIFSSGDAENELKERLSEEAYKELNRRLLEKEGVTIDELDSKQPWIVDFLLDDEEFEEKESDFNAFLDYYLYDYAKKLGKKTYGLEEIEDQLDLSLLKFQNIEDYMKDSLFLESDDNDELDNLLLTYISGDISEIDEKYIQTMPDNEYKQRLLMDRNYVMARSIERLGNQQSMFNVVGAAHLPGKDGLIDILRKKGYTLRPVSNDFTGKSKFKDLSHIQLPWYTKEIHEMNATLDFPIEPFKIEEFGDSDLSDFNFLMSIDGFNKEVFMYLGLNVPYKMDDDKKEEFFDVGFNAMFRENAELKNVDYGKPYEIPFEKYNAVAKGIKGSSDENSVEGVIILTDYEIHYLIILKENNKSIINAKRFFDSIKIKEREEIKGETVLEKGAISFNSPVAMVLEEEMNTENYDGIERSSLVSKYSGSDENEKNYYLIQYYDMPGGVFINEHTVIFDNIKDGLGDMGKILESSPVLQKQGHPYIQVKIESLFNVYMKAAVILRGNRMYMVIVTSEGEKECSNNFDQFFNSIQFLPFQKSQFHDINIEDIGIKAKLVGPSELENEYYGYPFKTGYAYHALDASNSTTQSFEWTELSDYYYIENLDSFLIEKYELVLEDDIYSDSKYEIIEYQGYPAIDMYFELEDSKVNDFTRVIYLGNNILYCSLYIPEELKGSGYTDEIFNSIQIDKNHKRSDATQSKTKFMLQNLSTDDEEEYEIVTDALYYHTFTQEELPLIYEALKKDYPIDSNYYYKPKMVLFESLAEIQDETTIPFLLDLYHSSNDENQADIINAVSYIEKDNLKEYWKLLDHFNNKYPRHEYYLFDYFYEDDEFAYNNISEILKYYNEKQNKSSILGLLSNLVSSYDMKNIIKPHEETLFKSCQMAFNEYKTGNEDLYYNYDLNNYISTLLPTTERSDIIEFFHQQLNHVDDFLLIDLASTLVNKNKEIPLSIYDKMYNQNVLGMFLEQFVDEDYDYYNVKHLPKKYKKQDIAAKFAMIQTFEYDYYMEEIEFIKKDKFSYQNEKFNRYIFKLKDDYNDTYLGVILQPKDKKQLLIEPIYWNYDSYDSKTPLNEQTEDLMEYFYEEY